MNISNPQKVVLKDLFYGWSIAEQKSQSWEITAFSKQHWKVKLKVKQRIIITKKICLAVCYHAFAGTVMEDEIWYWQVQRYTCPTAGLIGLEWQMSNKGSEKAHPLETSNEEWERMCGASSGGEALFSSSSSVILRQMESLRREDRLP